MAFPFHRSFPQPLTPADGSSEEPRASPLDCGASELICSLVTPHDLASHRKCVNECSGHHYYVYLRTCTFQKILILPKGGSILGTGWLLGSYLRKRGLLCALHHVLQYRRRLVPQWSWEGTSHQGGGCPTGKSRPPHPRAALSRGLCAALPT